MPRTEVRAKGQITLPAEVREKAHIEEGDLVEVEIVPEGILLRPQKVVDATQAWFWTPAWQERVKAAEEDMAAGRVIRFDSDEDFLKALREIDERAEERV